MLTKTSKHFQRNAVGLTSGEVDVRWRSDAALRVACAEAEVVGFPAAHSRHIAGVLLGDAQSPVLPADDGRQGKVCRSACSIPGHDGGRIAVTLDIDLHLCWHTGS